MKILRNKRVLNSGCTKLHILILTQISKKDFKGLTRKKTLHQKDDQHFRRKQIERIKKVLNNNNLEA